MKLIAGLGNPGSRYEATRHNAGFAVVDRLAHEAKISFSSTKFQGEYGQGTLLGEKVALLKPQTYMNLSGDSVAAAARFYKVEPTDLIVIHDEMDLALGRLQLKRGGGAGGHHGIESIIDRLGSADFIRLRVGIGKPEGRERVVGHVLSGFGKEEAALFDEAAANAVEAVRTLLTAGLAKAMTRFNKR